eukprot:17539-Amphidinium_carterae.1
MGIHQPWDRISLSKERQPKKKERVPLTQAFQNFALRFTHATLHAFAHLGTTSPEDGNTEGPWDF